MLPIDWKPETRKLKQFGWIALVAFGALAGWILWRGGLFGADFGAAGRPVAISLAALGALCGLLSLAAPQANRWLYVGLMVVTWPIGFVVSFVMLGVLFFLVVSPISFIMRLLGRDTMHRRFDRNAPTYWRKFERARSPESYFRQY